jgi:hypothetical protein
VNTPSSAPDEQIFDELMGLQGSQRDLIQFRNLACAHQYLRLYRLVRGYLPEGSHVLDWGAGNFHFSYFLTRAGYRATGYSVEAN